MNTVGRLIRASKSDSSGQTLTLVAIFLPLLLGMLGLAIDTGNLYIAKRHLQTATDAAALAAAQDLPDGTQALSDACTFGATPAGGSCPTGVASTDGQNVSGELGKVSTSAQLECLSATSAGASCVTGTGCQGAHPPAGDTSNPGCNAIKISQTGSVKTFLLGLLGFVSTKVTTTSTASMGGGRSSPLDVQVVLDSTSSMQAFDNCGAPNGTSGVAGIPYANGKTPTAEDCAKAGMRALLETLYPCNPDDPASTVSCGVATQNNYPDPEDEVGLMSIPPLGGNPNPPSGHPAYVSPGNGLGIPAETNCIDDLSGGGYFRLPGGSDVTTSNYDSSNLPQYQFVPLSSDYKLSNATAPLNDSLLNADSNLVKAVYWGKCPGGAYPANGGSQGSSLSTPGAGDYSTANNNNSTTITINRPSTRAADDLLIVAVTVQSQVSICAPDASWTGTGAVASGATANDVTTEAFYSYRSSLDPAGQAYTFSIVNGSCGSGTPATRPATAVAVRYSGARPVAPIEVTASKIGAGTTLTTAPVTTGNVNDAILSLYGSSSPPFSSGVSQSVSSTGTASAFESTVQTAPGTTATQSAATSTAGPWVSLTVAIAAADGGCSGQCAYGLEDPGGAATYYANAITAAKAALDAAAANRPDAKKVIILLSDGVGNVYTSTPCQDAIKNAMAAETATPTSTAATIYTIAYGESGDRCSDSRSLTTLGTTTPITGACAMRLIADNPRTDTTHGLAGGSVANAQAVLCSGTIATDAPEHFYLKASGSDLASVFREIGQALASPRLVSDSAT
jgi:Flp pilus assembly protein TadG